MVESELLLQSDRNNLSFKILIYDRDPRKCALVVHLSAMTLQPVGLVLIIPVPIRV